MIFRYIWTFIGICSTYLRGTYMWYLFLGICGTYLYMYDIYTHVVPIC